MARFPPGASIPWFGPRRLRIPSAHQYRPKAPQNPARSSGKRVSIRTMSDPVGPSPLPEAAAGRKPGSRLHNVLLATLVGAVIGALLVRRSSKPPPFDAGLLLTPMAICLELWLLP